MANHANLDTNAPHLASRGAFWHRVGCKLPWGGVHFGVGGVHFQREGCILIIICNQTAFYTVLFIKSSQQFIIGETFLWYLSSNKVERLFVEENT